MGIQQCMTQRRRWMEGRIHNKIWSIRTNSHVLWIMQFTSNISNNDEWNFSRHDTWKMDHHLHGQHFHIHQNDWRKCQIQRLVDNDLYLKPEKCIFWTKEVEYLGMIISENQLQMDPVKLRGIAEWPVPTKVKNVRSFLGFGNYYCQFIHNYRNITRPLNDLLGKNKNEAKNAKKHSNY